MRFSFTRPTLFFCLAGIFLSGFTVIGLAFVQMLLESFGIGCPRAWNIIWTITSIVAIVVPTVSYLHLKKIKLHQVTSFTIVFNLIEFICIQSGLLPLFITAKNLCYSSDGQLVFVFIITAWGSLPVLVLLNLLFDRKYSKLVSEGNS